MHAKIIQKIRLQQKVSKHTAYGYLVFTWCAFDIELSKRKKKTKRQHSQRKSLNPMFIK